MPSPRTRIIGSVLALIAISVVMASLMPVSEILDARYYYTSDEASQLFANLSEARAHAYLVHELFDFLFISFYSLLAFTVVEILFSKTSKIKIFAFVPGVLDLIETGSIVAILLGAPATSFVRWLSFMTCIKWSSGGILLVVILFRAIVFWKRKNTPV